MILASVASSRSENFRRATITIKVSTMSRTAEISLSVTDPTKCTEKFGSVYIRSADFINFNNFVFLYHVPHTPSSYSYKIHSNTSRSGFESGAHSVVRRYSDFTWLAQELSKEFPGVIVPPLPEKLTVGRFGEEFVDSRRRGLEKFLLRIASHTELSNSQYFIVFLQAAESGLAEAKNESKNSSKAKTGTTIGWLEGTVNNLTTGAKVSERFTPHSAAILFLIMTHIILDRLGEVCRRH